MNPEILYIKKFNGVKAVDYKTQFVDGVWEFKDSGAAYCGQCRLIYPNLERANQCCQNNKCSECGKTCERKYYTACDSCIREKDKLREKEKFNKAKKLDIKDYTGYLLDDETATDDYGAYLENYFENNCTFDCPICQEETETKDCPDVKEHSHLHCKNPDCKWQSQSFEVIEEIYYLFAPEYIWAADFEPAFIDIGRVLENALDSHHESVPDYVKGNKELKEAIDKWNELNKNIGSYTESNTLTLINIRDYVKELYNK